MRLPPPSRAAQGAYPAAAVPTSAAGPELAPAGSSRGRLARNIAVLAGGQLATWALTALWTVFVPNRLGPAGMGRLGVATAVTTILGSILGLGIGTLMTKEIARDHDRAPSLVGSSLLLRLALLPPSTAAVAGYEWLTHPDPQLGLVIWLATGAMLLGLFAGPFLAALQGLERMQFTAYSDVLNKAVVSFASVGLVLAGFGLVPLMWLGLAMAAVVMVLTWVWSRPYFRPAWRLDLREIRHLSTGSLPYWTTGLVLTFYMWIDLLMLDRMAPIAVVGWYNVPTKLFSTLLVVPSILSVAFFPRLSRAFRGGVTGLTAEARPALEIVLILSLPVAVGTALVARQLIWVLYGAPFLPAAPVLSILALCLPPTYLNMMANQVLIAANRQVVWTKVMLAAAVFNPLLNLELIRAGQSLWGNGALGAAVALLGTELGMAGAALVLMPRVLSRGSWLRLLRAAAATAGMAATVWFVSHRGLAVQVGAGVLVFAALGALFRVLTRGELTQLLHLAGRLRR